MPTNSPCKPSPPLIAFSLNIKKKGGGGREGNSSEVTDNEMEMWELVLKICWHFPKQGVLTSIILLPKSHQQWGK